jgi:hypothetical protein
MAKMASPRSLGTDLFMGRRNKLKNTIDCVNVMHNRLCFKRNKYKMAKRRCFPEKIQLEAVI